MSKRRPQSQANQLRAAGVAALGTYAQDGRKENNPVDFYSPDKDAYRRIWTEYDLQQYCSMGIWDGLPAGLPSWNLQRMRYFRGTLAAFNYGGKGYILPFAISGGLNAYGLPTAIKPITYNGENKPSKTVTYFKDNLVLPVYHPGSNIKDKCAVLLYDSVPNSPATNSPSPFILGQVIINDIAETLARININVVVSNKKILLIVKDPEQAEVVKMELEVAFNSDSPFGVITSPLDTQTPQTTSDYNADDLFNTVKNWDAIRCFMRGIASKNFGTEKKERLVSGELAGNEEQQDLIDDLRTDLAKLFCKQCNEVLGWNISYKSRRQEYRAMGEERALQNASTETNGNGQTKLQEQKQL